MEYLYKYSYAKCIAKYAVISGEIGDINLKLRDVTNYNDEFSEHDVACEVAVIRHGKVYHFVEPLNEIAEFCLHNLEGVYYMDEKTAILERVQKQLKSCTDAILDQTDHIEYIKEKLNFLKEKAVKYLTCYNIKLGGTYYIPQIGEVKVIGIISGIDGKTSYLTDSNYNTPANCDDDSGDRIILVKDDKKDRMITEHGNNVYMSANVWRINLDNNEIKFFEKRPMQKRIQYTIQKIQDRTFGIYNKTSYRVNGYSDNGYYGRNCKCKW